MQRHSELWALNRAAVHYSSEGRNSPASMVLKEIEEKTLMDDIVKILPRQLYITSRKPVQWEWLTEQATASERTWHRLTDVSTQSSRLTLRLTDVMSLAPLLQRTFDYDWSIVIEALKPKKKAIRDSPSLFFYATDSTFKVQLEFSFRTYKCVV